MLGVQHEFVGGIIGLVFSLWLLIQGHPLLAVGCFLISMWGANLPDLIDPPTSPFHRSIGHNLISFFLFILVSIISLSLALIFKSWLFIITASFSLSVLSHLVLDLFTPIGLPLFAGKSILGLIEIPLYLIPYINILMLIITIILAFKTIKYLAQKLGGKTALFLLLIPIWSSTLLLGIALLSIKWLTLFGYFFLFIFTIMVILIYLCGNSLNSKIKKKISKKT
ncbi:metal-dependent hydrolase [Candidatus Woesearchaeota archaeon]|nr:metal-dependent hydrolase [Candidatus Woesearchaeota archaeon]